MTTTQTLVVALLLLLCLARVGVGAPSPARVTTSTSTSPRAADTFAGPLDLHLAQPTPRATPQLRASSDSARLVPREHARATSAAVDTRGFIDVLWNTAFASNQHDTAQDVAVHDDSAFVVGSFQTALYAPTEPIATTLLSAGQRDLVVARIDLATGVVVWALGAGGVGVDMAESVAVMPGDETHDAAIIVVGSFQDRATFGRSREQSLTTPYNSACGSTTCYGAFIAKHAYSNGELLWVVAATGTLHDKGAAVMVTSNAIWMTGVFGSASVRFSNGGALGGAVTTYAGVDNGVLTKIDRDNGAVLMARQIVQYGSSDVPRNLAHVPPSHLQAWERNDLARNGATKLAVYGVFRGDAVAPHRTSTTVFGLIDSGMNMLSRGGADLYVLMITVSPTTVRLAWAAQLGGSGDEWLSASSLALALPGSSPETAGLVVAGEFRGTSHFLGAAAAGTTSSITSVSTRGSKDGFVARLNSITGSLEWAASFGSANADVVYALAAHEAAGLGGGDAVWVTGAFTAPFHIGSSADGSHVVLQEFATSTVTAFVAKYDANTGMLLHAVRVGAPRWARVTGLQLVDNTLLMLSTTEGSPMNIDTGDANVDVPFSTHGGDDIVITRVALSSPVDCVVSAWTAWSPCSVLCGGGTQSRVRVVLRPPQEGGAACPELTDGSQRVCNDVPCHECAMPQLQPNVTSDCAATADTHPIVCTFGCSPRYMQLEQPASLTCEPATGEWTGVVPRCILATPHVTISRSDWPVKVAVAVPAGAQSLVYATRAVAGAGADLEPDLDLEEPLEPPSCAAASPTSRFLPTAAQPALELQLEGHTLIAVAACGPAAEGDVTRSATATELVTVAQQLPSLAVYGPAYPKLVVLHAATLVDTPETPMSVAATMCSCFLPTVLCNVSPSYSGPAYAVLRSSQSVAARTCGDSQRSVSGPKSVYVPVDAIDDAYAGNRNTAARVKLQFAPSVSVGDGSGVAMDVAHALILVDEAASDVPKGGFIQGLPTYETGRIAELDVTVTADAVTVEFVFLVDNDSDRTAWVLAQQLATLVSSNDKWLRASTALLHQSTKADIKALSACESLKYGNVYGCAQVSSSTNSGTKGQMPSSQFRDDDAVTDGSSAISWAPWGNVVLITALTLCVAAFAIWGVKQAATSHRLRRASSSYRIAPSTALGTPVATSPHSLRSAESGEEHAPAWQELVDAEDVLSALRRDGGGVEGAAVYTQAAVAAAQARAASSSHYASAAFGGGAAGASSSEHGSHGRRHVRLEALHHKSKHHKHNGKRRHSHKSSKNQQHKQPRKTRLSKGSKESDEDLCVACLANTCTVMLFPCQHLCLCQSCSSHSSIINCPLCRAPIGHRVLFQWGGNNAVARLPPSPGVVVAAAAAEDAAAAEP